MSTFDLFPAVDVSSGDLSRLSSGGLTRLGVDPVEVARGFVAGGARWIHVVDLDAALGDGSPRNLAVLERIAALGVRVQAGGGLSPAGVAEALRAGADRAILGARWIGDESALAGTVAAHGSRAGVGLDVDGEAVRDRKSVV